MKRRDFLSALLAVSVLYRPLAAQQPNRVRRVGIIDDGPLWDYFRERLRELGDIDGQNIALEYRIADGDPERILDGVRELARLPVDVIAVAGSTAAKAAQTATDTVPIVAMVIGDPVAIGLVKNRARPGGNITGNMIFSAELAAKRLQLLKSMLPHLSRVAYFWNPNNASSRPFLEQLQAAAKPLDVTMVPVEARATSEFDRALALVASSRVDAMITAGDVVQRQNLNAVLDFQVKHRLPGMFTDRQDVAAGGLMSYGIRVHDLYRHGADYTHKLLHGARPGELPFEQATRFELVINLTTAKTLGLTIPRPVLTAADEIIEWADD